MQDISDNIVLIHCPKTYDKWVLCALDSVDIFFIDNEVEGVVVWGVGWGRWSGSRAENQIIHEYASQ